MEQAKTIEQAAQELREARSRYDEIHLAYQEARRRETDALNTLNRAQQAFDQAVAAVKEDAPRDSGWHSRNRRGEQATA